MTIFNKDKIYRYMLEHVEHVKIMQLNPTSDKLVEPSNEDLNHPELWKSSHWNWFFDNHFHLYELAEIYAIECHKNVNHTYDGKPYETHLEMVYRYAKRFLDLIPNYRDKEKVLAACWMHDLIEDTRTTYSDIKGEFGEEIAELVYALTNEKGRNRAERANKKYYNGIRKTKYATFIKYCDRLANICYSQENCSSMFEKYKKEHKHFIFELHDSTYKPMIIEMEKILWA